MIYTISNGNGFKIRFDLICDMPEFNKSEDREYSHFYTDNINLAYRYKEAVAKHYNDGPFNICDDLGKIL